MIFIIVGLFIDVDMRCRLYEHRLSFDVGDWLDPGDVDYGRVSLSFLEVLLHLASFLQNSNIKNDVLLRSVCKSFFILLLVHPTVSHLILNINNLIDNFKS